MRLRTVSKVVAALVSRSTGPADHAATQAAVQHACNPADWSALPAFCNTTLQMDDRINDLIERLTIDEKVSPGMLHIGSHPAAACVYPLESCQLSIPGHTAGKRFWRCPQPGDPVVPVVE